MKIIFITLACYAILKNGIHPIGMQSQVNFFINYSTLTWKDVSWPSSIIYYLLPHILNIKTVNEFQIYYILFFVANLFFVYLISKKIVRHDNRLTFLILALGGPSITTILYGWGNYDLLFITFSSALIAFNGVAITILLSCCLALTNPEQAIVTSFCLLIMSIVHIFNKVDSTTKCNFEQLVKEAKDVLVSKASRPASQSSHDLSTP